MSITDFFNLGFEQYADLGFTLLIGGVCLRTLLFDREVNSKQRAVWKQELVELEKSLRSLIDEASHASHLFDKQLTVKQTNIQKLADKAETLLKTSITNATKHQAKKKSPFNEEDFNEEFQSAPHVKTNKNRAVEQYEEDEWTYGDDVPSHLASAINFADTVEDRRYHGRLSQHSSRSPQKQNQTKSTLMINEEKKKQEALADEKIFSQTSIVDPVAYRIAKRLLLEGKELHVIARKLEMPVSEIRHLETLIRHQAQDDLLELPETFKAKDIEPVTKVIRDRGEQKRPKKLLVESIQQVFDESEDPGLVFEDETELPLTLEK